MTIFHKLLHYKYDLILSLARGGQRRREWVAGGGRLRDFLKLFIILSFLLINKILKKLIVRHTHVRMVFSRTMPRVSSDPANIRTHVLI